MNEVCNTSSNCWLPNKSAIKYFSTRRLIPLLYFKKKIALSIAELEFLQHFLLLVTVSEVCNISNKYYLLIDQLKKRFYTRYLRLFLHFKTTVLYIAEAFTNIHFLPHFYLFSRRMTCAIFRINTNLLVIQEHINIFTQEVL